MIPQMGMSTQDFMMGVDMGLLYFGFKCCCRSGARAVGKGREHDLISAHCYATIKCMYACMYLIKLDKVYPKHKRQK